MKLGRGLYSLPGAVYSGPVQTVQSVPKEARVESIPSADLTEGVDEWKEPSSREYRNSYTVDIPDEDPVCGGPELKSAEPKWSRGWRDCRHHPLKPEGDRHGIYTIDASVRYIASPLNALHSSRYRNGFQDRQSEGNRLLAPATSPRLMSFHM